jgi:hypothetical protein
MDEYSNIGTLGGSQGKPSRPPMFKDLGVEPTTKKFGLFSVLIFLYFQPTIFLQRRPARPPLFKDFGVCWA